MEQVDYYKVYTRSDSGYSGPKIVKTLEELLKMKFTKNNYLIIGHNNKTDSDINITLEECEVEFVDEVETSFEVKATTFKPKQLQKENKAKKKQELYNLTKDYIDR